MFGSFWGPNAAEINSAVKCGWVAVDRRLGHSAGVETIVPESAIQVLISAKLTNHMALDKGLPQFA